MRPNFLIFCSALILLFLLGTVGAAPLLVPFTLLTGWIVAGARLWSALHFDPRQVGLVLLAVLILVLGTHRFCVWLIRSRVGAVTPQWRWRWTLVSHAAFWLALLAGFAVIAMVHQTGWMFTSGEPWFFQRPRMASKREAWDVRQVAQVMQGVARTNNWDASAIKSAFWAGQGPSPTYLQALFESHVLVLFPTNGTASEFLIVPRGRGRWIAVCRPEGDVRIEPRAALTNVEAWSGSAIGSNPNAAK